MELIEGREYKYTNPVGKETSIVVFSGIESGLLGTAFVFYCGDVIIKIPEQRAEYDIEEYLDNEEDPHGVDELDEHPVDRSDRYKAIMFGDHFVDTNRLHKGIFKTILPDLMNADMTRMKYENHIRAYSPDPQKHLDNFALCVLVDVKLVIE
jgi:hypothetical protein